MQLFHDLMRDEGFRERVYRCSAGKQTIGYGWNIDDQPISRLSAQMILADQIDTVTQELNDALPWWETLPDNAKLGLANMAFNLGLTRLLKFKKMLAALEAHDFGTATLEALESKWARQVGSRALRIADLFKSCNEDRNQ
jgi:lysozyme